MIIPCGILGNTSEKVNAQKRQRSMRWKLLGLVSIGSALVAFCLWEVIIHVIFGSVRPVQRHDWLLLASASVPLIFATFSAVFIYRHTARRRKTQAIIGVFLMLILAAGTYLAGARLFPELIAIPRPCEGNPSRPCR